jgi:Putative phage tail protein
MATLLLTAVGTAIGGPVGGAIGGLLGQALDSRVLFPPKGRQGPRLTELQVQASSYGTQIPQIFGAMRVAGCVIWATDLQESSARSGGGKGQPSVTNYSYSVSFAVALSGRAITDVGRIWADGKLLRGAAGDFKSATGFRLHRGGEDQPVDPLIAAAEGAGAAPAHRGIAYVVFEDFQLADYGNRIPSLTFEVIADAAPVAVGDIAEALGGGVLTGAGRGLTLDGFSAYGDSARAVVDVVAGVGGAWFASEDGALALAIAEDVVAAEVRDAGVGGSRRQRRVAPIETTAKTLGIEHYDPARDYQTGVQQVTRSGAGWRAERIDVPASLSAVAAKRVAMARMAAGEAGRRTRTVALGLDALAIAPGAIVRIAGEAGQWRVAKATCEGFVVTLDLVALAIGVGPLVGATSGRVAGAQDVAIGETILAAIETPALDDALLGQPRLTIVASGTEPGWRRAALHYSLDSGASWTAIGTTAPAGVIGTLETPLDDGPATMIDHRRALDIVFAHDGVTLTGADMARIDGGANLAIIGDELVQFETATRIAARRWRLTGIWRGRGATAVAAHATGSPFVLIEAASAVVVSLAAQPGQVVEIMAVGVGDTAPVTVTRALSGAAIVPPSPVHLRVERNTGGGATATWVRRARSGGLWIDGTDVPLGEDREAYRIEIDGDGTDGVLAADGPTLDIDADGLPVGPGSIRVRQLGSRGVSAPAELSI